MRRMCEALIRDVGYSLRLMRRTPALSVAVVLSLALGIGANVATFSVVNALLFKTLASKDPNRLVCVDIADDRLPKGRAVMFSYPTYISLQEGNSVLDGLIADSPKGKRSIEFGGSQTAGEAERANLTLVSGNYLSTLGVAAYLGRVITADDDSTAAETVVAVVTYDFWKHRLGGDGSIVGRSLRVGGVPVTIIGVTTSGFSGTTIGDPADILVPLAAATRLTKYDSPILTDSRRLWLRLMGRLKPGMDMGQAALNLNGVYRAALESEGNARRNGTGRVGPQVTLSPGAWGRSSLRSSLSGALTALMAVVITVLLVACANIANLLLAQGAARKRELSLRVAVGAGRWRLVGQLLVESVTISLIGGACGVVLAYWGSQSLLALLSDGPTPIALDVGPDLRVLTFTAALSLLTGTVFGMAPALHASRVDPARGLSENRGGTPSRAVAKTLLAGQVALSLVLLAAAALFARSLAKLRAVDLGFNESGLYQVSWGVPDYSEERLAVLFERVTEEVAAMPGVQSASVSASGLFANTFSGPVRVEGASQESDGSDVCQFDWVGRNFFETVGIPAIRGRTFGAQDYERSPRVTVINEALALRYFGATDPIGARMYIGRGNKGASEIIGVVKDAKSLSLRETVEPKAYSLYLQYGDRMSNINTLEVRGITTPALSAAIRARIKSIDPNFDVEEVSGVSHLVDQTIWRERAIAKLSGFFGFLAILLVGVGLSGTLSYWVSLRTNEIGIRAAMGATPAAIQRLVLGELLVLLGLGAVIGLPLALAANRSLSALLPGFLFGVSSNDPVAIGLALLLIAAISAFAGYLPARRAAHVNPMVALRHE